MSSIKQTKKAMKKSSSFLSVKVRGMVFPINEWDEIKFHTKGISINTFTYIPYKLMKVIYIHKNLIA